MSLAVDATLRVSLVLAVALLGAALLPRRSAALRRWLLTASIACAAVLPVISWAVPAWPIPPVLSVLAAGDDENGVPVGDAQVAVVVGVPATITGDMQPPGRAPASSGWPGSTVFATVWVVGAILGLSRGESSRC